MLTTSPTSPSTQQQPLELITSEDFLPLSQDDFHDENGGGPVLHHRSKRALSSSSIHMVHSNNIGRNVGAKHVFLKSQDYSLFRKSERLVWQLNHLHANINQLITKNHDGAAHEQVTSSPRSSMLSTTTTANSPTSPSLSNNNSKNIQVISVSIKTCKDLSVRKNRFLKNHQHVDSHHHHHNSSSMDESTTFTSGFMHSSEYSMDRNSMQNSPTTTISDESYLNQFPFTHDSIPRSMSIDQLHQATNSNIVRSISIDQIHYGGSNQQGGGVVILPPNFYNGNESSPKFNQFHGHLDTIETVSSTASTEEFTEDLGIELLPTSLVHTIYSKYGIVITVDISPSMLAIDTTTGEVLFDRVFKTISNILTHLTQPIIVPNYSEEILPELHVSCIAIGMAGRPVYCLFQDYHITSTNLVEVLGKVYQNLCETENMASNALRPSLKSLSETSDSKFNTYISDSILAFDFLPKDACPIFLLISDNVFNISDLTPETILSINQKDISFATINITNQSQGAYLYSYLPDSELVESFIACVDGYYIDYEYIEEVPSENDRKKTNALQHALLFRPTPVLAAENESLIISAGEGSVFTTQTDIKKDVKKGYCESEILAYSLNMTNVDSILKTRAKQGFKIMDLKYATNTDSLTKFKAEEEKLDYKSIKMSLLYRRNIEIIYRMQIERTDVLNEEQDLQMLSSSNFTNFALTKLKNFKIVVTITAFMHKSNQERFKMYLKKKNKELSFFKSVQDFIQKINIEDVLLEQYHNLADNCSCTNRTPIRKLDLSNINFEHEKDFLFDRQTLMLSPHNDEQHLHRSDSIIQKILTQIQSGTTEITTVQNHISILRSLCDNSWSSTKISDDFYILFLSEQDSTCYLYESVDDTSLLSMEEKDSCVSSGFCLLKLLSNFNSPIEIQFQFFNVSSFTISRIIRQFKEKITRTFHQKGISANFYVSEHFPDIASRLPNCREDESQYNQSLYSAPPHYTSYMKHKNWVWSVGGRLNVAGILSSIFSQRFSEGFSLVSSKQSIVFVKELEMMKRNAFNDAEYLSKLLVFYCIHILKKEKKLITELWIEPQSGYVTHSSGALSDSSQFYTDLCDNWFYNLDLQIISLFSTFECVVTACKSGKGNNNNIAVFQAEKNNLPTPFNLKGIVDRSEKQDLQFKVFKISSESESELCKKNNILLYDRLIKFLSNINDVELNIDRIPLNLNTKSRCFARVFETVGSERQKDFILTIVPAQVNGEELNFNIIVCECNEDQLLNIENLKRNEAIEKLVCSKNGPLNVKAHPMLMHEEEQAFSSSASYCDFVTNLHSYSLSYGVYKHLNQKLLVDRENIVSAVESCYEYREEIDLSEFFEAILLARSYFFEKGENGISPCESMAASFKAIIEKYFDDIRGTKYHYYLRESSIPKTKNQTTTTTNPKILKKKNSAKSFDHLEEIENEDFDAEASDDEISSFHSEEDEIHSISTSISAGARADTHPHSDHASDSLTDSSGSSLTDTFNSVELENSTIPVFMRMECVLSPIERDHDSWNELDNDSENISSTIKVPIKKLPIDKIASTIMSSKGEFAQVLSAFSKDEDSEDEEEEPESFTRSSMDLDWINSLNSVKTSLRLYCITLPPDKHFAAVNGFEPAKKDLLMMFRNHVTESQFAYARSVFDVEEDSSADVPTDEAAPYLDKGYLPRHIRRIMSRTNKRLQALISKEILNALLKTHPITSYSIKKVFDNIEKLPTTCYQKHSIPLFFIDPVEGLKLFHQEMAKCKNLVFKNIENHYILYFRKRNCCSKHTIFEDFDKACEQDATSDNNKYNLYKKELDDLEMVIFDNDIEMERSCLELPFWIILRVENKKSMSMLFYSPTALSTKHANDVVSVVFKAISVICKRVNTLLLLSNLHDTRLCSSLLLPFRKEKDKKALQNEINTLDKKLIRKDNEKPNPEKFKEGDFACRKTYEISFPLHSRLTTAMAINHLNQAVFNPFIVANRSEMFVYKERSGRVFYLQLVDGNKQVDVLSPTTEKSPEIPEQPEQSDQEFKTKLKDYSLSLSSMGQYLYAELDLKNKTSSIVLEVYGVYSPSAEITAQLRNLIEGKLSALTMNIISNLLLRNRQFKVTVEDLEFIRPLLQKPQKSVLINIPKFINNKLLFMLFLRNNMLTFMNQLYLSSSDDSTDSNNPQAYMSFTEDEDDDMVFKAWDFSFLFNSVTQNTFSRAMTSTVNCRGIACVQLTLLNQNGEMVTVFPPMKESYVCDLTGVSQLGNLQEEPANIPYTDFGAPILKKEGSNSDSEDEDDEVGTTTEVSSKSLSSENGKILFEFWKKGEVDIPSLLEKIVQTVNQSVIDYIVECGLFTNPLSLEGFNRYFLARLQTQAIKASRIDSPTLTEHRASIFLPLWEMGRFIGDLYNLLSVYSFKFRPVTFVSTDGRQNFVKYSRSEDFTEKYHLIDSNNVCFAMIAGNILVQNNDRVINIGENIKIGDIISLEGFNYRNSFKYNRKCCIVIILTSAELQVIAYNWKSPQFEKFKYHLHQTVSWLRCRAHLLNSILHQKLGLFYHSHSSNLVSIPSNPLNPSQSGKPQKEVQFAFNNIDLLIYNKQNAPVDPKTTTTIRRSTTTPSTPSTMNAPKQMPDVRGQIYNRFKTPQTTTPIQVATVEVKSEVAKPIRKEKKPQSSKNQFGSLLKGIYDLDKNPGRYLSRRTPVESKKDQLLIHGLHFKHIVHQNYKKKVEQQQVSKIYGFWNNKSYSTSLKSKDFQLIKNTSRLIHFCRVPLLFNPLRRILFDPSSFVSSSSAAIIQQMDLGNTSSFEDTQNNNLREIGYHRKVFESFLSEYVEYVKSLDISDVFLNPSEQNDIPSTPGAEPNLQISITREKQPKQPTPLVQVVGNQIIKLQPTTIYFQKQMDEGVLFLELGLDSIYAYLNVYVSDTVSQKPSGLMHNRSSSRGEFLKKVSQFKHSLHMNSFSYDFHLRNFLNYLTTDYSGFPPSLSFMCLLKDFAQFYPKPPPHTRNILHSHHIVFENSKDIADIMREKANIKASGNLERREILNDPFHFFFEYICKNSERYRVKFNQKSKECFILDTYISHDEADYSYSVIVTKSIENSTSHISPSSPMSEEMYENSTMNLTMYIVFADATNRHPYDSDVEGSKENMYKIVTQMAQQYERKLLNLLHSVKDSFKLDILWEMALNFKISENLFNDLDALWIKTPITDYDFTLSIFEANYIPWNDVISELWNIYGGERAGSIFKKDGTAQHLIITPDSSATGQNYLLHINYSILSNTISCYLCKKRLLQEPELLLELQQRSSSPKIEGVTIQDPRIPNDQEQDFIGTFVNRVCYVLYRLSF
ncbi:hypothetical protein NAEGRDRAFT_58984 [Naegleria gruberi]|uniref:Uncharacterized protein n=1 Tax=Naegleria gruberi TaxID=5762 RepID=D2VR30_NAEGR|nr:uncharacterized protein NAEGRDRAFT_58984 [Naegleria gruberi]EFC40819.1 hypothetical protein NAEGRDRAFT_58984 [Naegleria gruberi]|eukprot:XP_002673563.1 hypothetical protein NAEGRDRAFT_58984 [Naegleria gruberi strain NEG-M]